MRADIDDDEPRLEPYQEEECLLCVPAMNENAEKYTTLGVIDRAKVPLGEDDSDHAFEIPVCVGHYEAIEQYQRGANVEEIEW